MRGPVTVDNCFSAMRMSLVKRLWRQVDYQAATGAEVKAEWFCTSAPLIGLNGTDRANFTVCHLHAVDGVQCNICFLFRITFLGYASFDFGRLSRGTASTSHCSSFT